MERTMREKGKDDFFFQAEDGIRDLVRSRGLGDVYKRQVLIPEAVSILCVKYLLVVMNKASSGLPVYGMAVSYTHLTLPTIFSV
mgnify:CR=1 FL=1